MKIGLNATCLNDRPSGAKQRFIGIYSELIKRLPNEEFVIYEPGDCRVGSWFKGAPNVTAKNTFLPSEGRIRKFVSGLGYWSKTLKQEQFNIFEGFNLPLVKAPSGQTLLTIHDIRQMHSAWGALERTTYKMAIKRALTSADHVITVSESMKTEILNFFPKAQISVIYNGLDVHGFETVTESDLLDVHKKFSLADEFVLTVGHFEKRKNYLRLIDAMALLRDQGRPCNLLIIGNNSGERDVIEQRVTALNLTSNVKILSGLTDREVLCAYKLCSLFIFPSSYEGFGIPILEAMAAERPMVLSDLPVFREITQDKGVYFPFDDTAAMASAIEKVLSSDSEQRRLIEYGKKRIPTFSFSSLAAQLEAVYRKLT